MGYSELALKGAEIFNKGLQNWCKTAGKGFFVETLRPVLKNTELKGLRYAPKLEGDVLQLSLKPKTVLNYEQKQAMDIAKYGEKQVERIDVTDDMLQKFTPNRRLSNKPCTLKNPSEYKYYISKFEKDMGEKYLPKDWEKLTDAQKYDFIVKDRYSRIVANKIMDNIQHEHVEHCYVLNKDGDITGYSLCDIKSANVPKTEFDGITIHNHPHSLQQTGFRDLKIKIPAEEFCKNTPKSMTPHSCADIVNGYIIGGKHYVVDSNGNKFLLQTNNMPYNKYYIDWLSRDIGQDQQTALRFSSSDKPSVKLIFQLNDKLKTLNKKSDEDKVIAEELKQKLYKYHEETFNELALAENMYIVNTYSEVYTAMAKRVGGMRLMKIN